VLTEKSYQISKSNWFPDRVCIGGHKLLRSRCRIASLLSKYRTPFRYWRRALACCDYAQRCASRVLWRVALPRHRRNRSRWSEAIRGIRHKLREDACLSMRIWKKGARFCFAAYERYVSRHSTQSVAMSFLRECTKKEILSGQNLCLAVLLVPIEHSHYACAEAQHQVPRSTLCCTTAGL
jgi:hypothetical protein